MDLTAQPCDHHFPQENVLSNQLRMKHLTNTSVGILTLLFFEFPNFNKEYTLILKNI